MEENLNLRKFGFGFQNLPFSRSTEVYRVNYLVFE